MVLVSLLALTLFGCGGSVSAPSPVTTTTATGVALHGSVHAGQQPIVGAAVTLYAAGTTGYKTASVNVSSQSVTTAADGSFSTNAYTCTSGQQMYLIANGGKINGLANPAASAMATLGDCGSITTGTYASLNEVTTVGSVYALSQFMTSSTSVATSASNTLGLSNAFALVNNLVNIATGVASGPTLPAGAISPVSKINTLADLLFACHVTGGSACTILFQLTTPAGGTTPNNTVDALLAIAHSPSISVMPLYNTATSFPFTPRLSAPPPDWTLTLGYTGGGLHLPAAVAIDSTGSIWAANSAGVATKLSSLGAPASTTGFASTSLYESYGIAIDNQDNAWITNQQSSGVNGGGGSVTKFNSAGQVLSGTGFVAGGIYYPVAIAADSSGNMWVADYGRTGVTLLAPDGTSLSGASGFSSQNLTYPVSVAVDASKNAWLGTDGATTRITPSGSATPYTCCKDAPSGVAIDASGNVWLTDYTASALLELNANGTILQRVTGVGGLDYPQSVAIDGNGAIWVANFQGNSVSGFTPGPVSTTLSPAVGYGTDAGLLQPSSLAIDASGNVWVSNSANNTVTEFVGLAGQVRTPLAGPAGKP